MAYDPDIHELATRFPDAFLALLGIAPGRAYTVEAVEVKTSSRRIDLVFEPARAGDPRIYVEYQAWDDPDVERRLQQEVVNHCMQTGVYDPVAVAIVYARAEHRQNVRSADIGHGETRVLPFAPLSVVLTDLDPERVLGIVGSDALIMLPLLGTEELVRASARDWLQALQAATPGRAEQERVVDLFGRFVAWRLGRIDVLDGLEGAMDISETATGRALIARGVARGEAEGVARGRAEECRRAVTLVATARLGEVPGWLPARLDAVARLAELERILRGAANVRSAADLEALFRRRAGRGKGRPGS